LLVVVLGVGTGVSLVRGDAVTGRTVGRALLAGLVGVVVFQFTVGSVWGYVVEYRNAGGAWTDRPFLAPFVLAGVAGAAAGLARGSVALAAWVAFWAFVIAAATVAVGAWVVVGYRDRSA
jgi:hypothetical protein